VLSTRVVRASRGGNVSQSASESSESPAVLHAKPLINKKKNARFGAHAQLVGVTCDMQCHKIEATRHMK